MHPIKKFCNSFLYLAVGSTNLSFTSRVGLSFVRLNGEIRETKFYFPTDSMQVEMMGVCLNMCWQNNHYDYVN